MRYRRATPQDIPAIMALRSNMHVLPGSDAESSLLEEHAQESLRDRMRGNPYFSVLTYQRNLVAFLAAYDAVHLAELPHDEVIATVKRICRPLLFIDQVAVDPRWREQGHATRLYTELLADARRDGYALLVAAVAERPWRNEASIAFHERLGFHPLQEVEKNGLAFMLYERETCRPF